MARSGQPLDPRVAERLETRVRRIPAVEALGLTFTDWGEGTVSASAPFNRDYTGIFDSFHGGMLMTVADTIACFAILTLTGPDEMMATTDMNIRFLAACRTDCRATARVVKLGRQICPVAVDLFDANGTPVAVAQVTYMRLPKKEA